MSRFVFLFNNIYLFILSAPSLSRGMQDLLVATCMWDLVPPPGTEPGPLHWEHGVLPTGPPGKSLDLCLF